MPKKRAQLSFPQSFSLIAFFNANAIASVSPPTLLLTQSSPTRKKKKKRRDGRSPTFQPIQLYATSYKHLLCKCTKPKPVRHGDMHIITITFWLGPPNIFFVTTFKEKVALQLQLLVAPSQQNYPFEDTKVFCNAATESIDYWDEMGKNNGTHLSSLSSLPHALNGFKSWFSSSQHRNV